ncbi:MAG: hypothetical protein DDT34_01164 [Firmicutes bacterium]|nr:hypothetical protein [Bacillota bacterium]
MKALGTCTQKDNWAIAHSRSAPRHRRNKETENLVAKRSLRVPRPATALHLILEAALSQATGAVARRTPVGGSRYAHKLLGDELHIPPILPTHLIQRMADLTEAVGLHRFHQRGKQVLSLSRRLLQRL